MQREVEDVTHEGELPDLPSWWPSSTIIDELARGRRRAQRAERRRHGERMQFVDGRLEGLGPPEGPISSLVAIFARECADEDGFEQVRRAILESGDVAADVKERVSHIRWATVQLYQDSRAD